MTAKEVLNDLLELRMTIERLHDANIITAEVGGMRPARIQLHVTGDPTEIIRGIGLGLIDVDNDTYVNWTRYSITDINGVVVEWLRKREAPDASPSEAKKEGDADGTTESISPSPDTVNDNRDRLADDLKICFQADGLCSDCSRNNTGLECREGLIADVIAALRKENTHESQN